MDKVYCWVFFCENFPLSTVFHRVAENIPRNSDSTNLQSKYLIYARKQFSWRARIFSIQLTIRRRNKKNAHTNHIHYKHKNRFEKPQSTHENDAILLVFAKPFRFGPIKRYAQTFLCVAYFLKIKRISIISRKQKQSAFRIGNRRTFANFTRLRFYNCLAMMEFVGFVRNFSMRFRKGQIWMSHHFVIAFSHSVHHRSSSPESSNDNFSFDQFWYGATKLERERTLIYWMCLSECIYFSFITFEVQLNLMASIIALDVCHNILCPMNLNQCQHNIIPYIYRMGWETWLKWTLMKRALLQFHMI